MKNSSCIEIKVVFKMCKNCFLKTRFDFKVDLKFVAYDVSIHAVLVSLVFMYHVLVDIYCEKINLSLVFFAS